MATPPTPQALTLLSQIAATTSSYADSLPGAREKLLSLTHALTAAVELPSEAIQRIGWAEVRLSFRPSPTTILSTRRSLGPRPLASYLT